MTLTNLNAASPYAKVVADSITEAGHRLTTFEVRFHRFVLAEFNTHRVFSRNSASSRAIPVEKQLARFRDEPWLPLEWPSEKPGMQGGEPLSGEALDDARQLLEAIQWGTASAIGAYLERHPEKAERLHKSLLNRPMEWAQQHTVVVSSTAWANFFRQRVSPLAQPEIRVAAEMMLDAYKQSEPALLVPGQYHLPYVGDDDEILEWLDENVLRKHGTVEEGARAVDRASAAISSARCARVSYLTQDGCRDPSEDLGLYQRLATADPEHFSPLEHPATPAPWNVEEVHLIRDPATGGLYRVAEPRSGAVTLTLPRVGNLLGWQQHRLEVEFDKQYQSFS